MPPHRQTIRSGSVLPPHRRAVPKCRRSIHVDIRLESVRALSRAIVLNRVPGLVKAAWDKTAERARRIYEDTVNLCTDGPAIRACSTRKATWIMASFSKRHPALLAQVRVCVNSRLYPALSDCHRCLGGLMRGVPKFFWPGPGWGKRPPSCNLLLSTSPIAEPRQTSQTAGPGDSPLFTSKIRARRPRPDVKGTCANLGAV